MCSSSSSSSLLHVVSHHAAPTAGENAHGPGQVSHSPPTTALFSVLVLVLFIPLTLPLSPLSPSFAVVRALVNANYRPRNQVRADRASLHYADLTTLPTSSTAASPLASVTDRSDLDEFLHSALMKEDAFEAEKQQLVVLDSHGFEAKAKRREWTPQAAPVAPAGPLPAIPIPRRPAWTSSMTAEALQAAEQAAFLTWRRSLAELEESGEVSMTPFEKNVEVWKQLWRVIERCSVVATIVDARNPLLYRSVDMEKYVEEMGMRGGEGVGGQKMNVLVINKADYLSLEQRRAWVRHFDREGVKVVFWSAVRAAKEEEERERRLKERERRRREKEARRERGLIVHFKQTYIAEKADGEKKEDEEQADAVQVETTVPEAGVAADEDDAEDVEDEEDEEGEEEEEEEEEEKKDGVEESKVDSPSAEVFSGGNSTDILTRAQLLDYFRAAYHSIHPPSPAASSSATSPPSSRIQIGFVGYPNVGKVDHLRTYTHTPQPASPHLSPNLSMLSCSLLLSTR